MKVAPVFKALQAEGVRQTIVHTGQHYDVAMSDVFFQQLGLPTPDVNLQVGSASHAQQTAAIMSRFEPILLELKPDWVLVYGDVNSTVAAALVCAKLLVPIAHVEAGLRSFDRTMPEEVNRIVVDRISDLLFTPSVDGDENLLKEGVPADRIKMVGNVMIDTLIDQIEQARSLDLPELPARYALVTLHRPANVDDEVFLRDFFNVLAKISGNLAVIFPVHPRTRQRIAALGLDFSALSGVRLIEPLSYIEFLAYQSRAEVVITDSGGIQEETTYLGVPCLTMRDNTERPVTITHGSNILIGRNMQRLSAELKKIHAGARKPSSIPPLWDGHAAERIAKILLV
jgi:UDP-N-acetylglucosamine 2-epimerase (non-hydrolysing)